MTIQFTKTGEKKYISGMVLNAKCRNADLILDYKHTILKNGQAPLH